MVQPHTHIILIVECLLHLGSVFSQSLTYTIAIQDDVFPFADPGLNMSTNLTLKIIPIGINDMTNVSALTAETRRISDMGVDFLIYMYSLTASLATNNMYALTNKIIPYLVLPELVDDPILNSNMFYIEYQEKMSSDATRALLSFLNTSSIVYIDYGPAPTSKNMVGFNNFAQTLVMVGNSTQLPSILIDIFRRNDQRYYVCAIPFSDSDLITSLMYQAMINGQTNSGKVWIFNRVTSNTTNFDIFKQFSRVGADIYSFGINFPLSLTISNTFQLRQYVARDYVRLIARSIDNTVVKPSNTSLQLINTVLPIGELITNGGFNPSTHKANGTVINVLKVNTDSAPITKYTYTDRLTEVNTDNITKRLNDSSITVRVGVILSKAYFMKNPDNVYYGYSVAILNELKKLTNFNFVYVFPNDSLTGEIVAQGTNGISYSGIVSLIKENLVDISIIPMVPTNIAGVIYPSDVLMQMQISMLTRQPDQEVDMTLVFVPFTYNVWLGIILIIYIMTLGFWSINLISPNHSKKCSKSLLDYFKSWHYSFLVIYSSFVTAKLKIKPRQPSLYIFAFILWFSTLTLVITYTSNMLPFMMVPNSAFPFKQASSFINNNQTNFSWGFVKNNIDTELVKNDSILSVLLNTSKTQLLNEVFFDDLTSETALWKNKYVLIQNANKNGYLFNRNCSLYSFVGTGQQYPLVFPMSNTWKQRFEMKALISQLIDSGTMNAVSNRYFNLGKCARSQDGLTPSPLALSLKSTIGVFLIPFSGIVLGIAVDVLKIVITKIIRCNKNMNNEKFVFGNYYDAKVSSLDHDGVWAFINQRDRPYFVSCTSLHQDMTKTFTPQELGIKLNDVIKLKYYGKDPVNKYKRFCKDMDEHNV